MKMKHSAICLIPVLAALGAGCPPDPASSSASLAAADAARLQQVQAGTKVDRTTHVLVICVKAVSIELPIGTASGSEEIWSYLDEEPVGVARGAALGRNGLRIGLGRGDSWPDLAKVLRRMTARRFRQSRELIRPGRPATFKLNERRDERTIFTSYPDRSLSGRDYPPGRDLLRLLCTLDEDEPSTVLMTGTLQIESARRRSSVAVLGARTGRTGPTVYSFPRLTFQLSVPAKGFVVVGPGAQARRSSSVGYNFLVRERDAVKFETVLVLVPEVLAAPIPKRPQTPGRAPPVLGNRRSARGS